MFKSLFHISQMDCPSEEQLIRMQLSRFDEIQSLEFDIPGRKLTVWHNESPELLSSALEGLKLQTILLSTETAVDKDVKGTDHSQRKILLTVLIINFLFFVLEMLFGVLSGSMGLVADSLDMLADSLVYGLALFAVGGSIASKNNIAKTAGYFQLLLALLGLIEVIRRFIGFEEMPDFQTMIIISLMALIANAYCLYLLQKERSKEVHMQASMIFTSNDIIINAGVILAGVLVHLLQSGFPDLIIGAIVFLIVARGAFRILKLAG